MLESDSVVTSSSSRTAVPIPDSDSNGHWQHSLSTLERELAAYRNATSASSRATEEERAGAAVRVAAAMRGAQATPSSPGGGAELSLSKDLPPIYQPAPSPTAQIRAGESAPIKAPQPKKLKRSAIDAHGAQPSEITPMMDRASSSSSESENPAKQIGRGLLMIVATPLAAAGMVIYASGLVVEGLAMTLKGIGSIGKKPFESVIKSKKKGRQ